MSKNITITIDGPAGAGKTSLAKLLADRYSLLHIRGGTYFRTLTYAIIKNKLDSLDENIVVNFAKEMQIDIDLQNNYRIYFDNKDITSLLHTEKINNLVTHISNYKEIRILRKKWIHYISQNRNIIVDGRTFGSEIFPNATIKFYLTSDIDIRANRRVVDYGYKHTYTEIYKSIELRDNIDKNSYIDKLKIPVDAHCIDSTNLSTQKTLDILCKKINSVL